MNGNGPDNRWANLVMLAAMAKTTNKDGLMVGCHDWVCPLDMARRFQDTFGLKAIIGAEITTDGGHLLALNIPEITPPIHGSSHAPVEMIAAIEEIHRLGGKAVPAHPFSLDTSGRYGWPTRLLEVTDIIDGVEIRNYKALLRQRVTEFDWFERKPEWLLTAASDCHPWEGDILHPDFTTEVDLAYFGPLVI